MYRAPTALIILDGFGYSTITTSNAIYHAHTPHLDYWFAQYPHTLLRADGTSVGLLPGMIGNSEVGHTTLGAGRIIQQPISRMHALVEQKALCSHPTLQHDLSVLIRSGGRLHCMGLLSDAGVHSHEMHLYALLDCALKAGVKDIYVHAFLDGRDVPPQSAHTYLMRLQAYCNMHPAVHIGSVHGRFYAMDRDQHWDRTQRSYQVITTAGHEHTASWRTLLQEQYDAGIFDEFIIPTLLDPAAVIQSGDGIIFFNVRPDRARQLTACFIAPTRVPFATQHLLLAFFLAPTSYDDQLPVHILFEKKSLADTLKHVLSAAGKTIFSIAETEKYAHITYFLGGGLENELPGESWVLIPSIPARDYVQHPCMSAAAITDAVLHSLRDEPRDVYLINYANADMVGHSGNFEATKRAIECLDRELGRLVPALVYDRQGTVYITADHGNAELKFNQATGQAQTAHTTNPVPFLMITPDNADKQRVLPLSELADVAPFILQQLRLSVPAVMKPLDKKGA